MTSRLVVAAITSALVVIGLSVPAAAGTGPRTSASAQPDLAAAVHYLTTATDANGVAGGTSLGQDGYYESFPQFADFGLTIDGAFALAATATANPTLQKVVGFIENAVKDPSGQSVNDWTGIGTAFASGGSIGKEALLAEVTGFDPRAFGGHDLISALDGLVCTTVDVANGCAGAGNYVYATSTISQALGIIAQLRAGDGAHAGAEVGYLESLQSSSGAWPSLLPSSGDSDVDSTAMAAMALALEPGDARAAAALTKAEAWIAGRQRSDGSFTGTSESTNSAALAVQAMTLAGSTYSAQIDEVLAFLAGQQNPDGGFNVDAGGQPGSDVRASTQVVSGAVGTSFGTLSDDIASSNPPTTTTSTTIATRSTPTTSVAPVTASSTSASTTLPSVGATNTGAGGASDAVSDTLPVTGSDPTRSIELVGGFLLLGSIAAGADHTSKRRRR